MSRNAKSAVLVVIFVVLFSAGGGESRTVAAPNQAIILKTPISGPSDFETSMMFNPWVEWDPTYHLYNNGTGTAYATAKIDFPKNKTAKWVKSFVVDNDITFEIDMNVFLVVPSSKATSLLGSTSSAGASTGTQVLKVAFNQKILGNHIVVVQLWVYKNTHLIYGAQGGYLK
ncbi:MAG: hypothetical protein OEZ02_14070 [Anaerolineae bacterium]|nr:hypothetical protein [Anaerolineae bacterium]